MTVYDIPSVATKEKMLTIFLDDTISNNIWKIVLDPRLNR